MATPVSTGTRPPTRIVAPSIGLDQEVMPVGWHQEEQGGGRSAQKEFLPGPREDEAR
jgi:hypothetical protein